jgi:hypothetical protein
MRISVELKKPTSKLPARYRSYLTVSAIEEERINYPQGTVRVSTDKRAITFAHTAVKIANAIMTGWNLLMHPMTTIVTAAM